MMKNSVTYNTLHFILVKIIWDIVYFPIWWYTKGFCNALRWFGHNIKSVEENLSLIIWLKHMFVPMYGQYSIAGRIISFFMRIVVLSYRTVFFVIMFIVLFAGLLFYIAVLPGVIYMIIRNFL